MHAKRKRREAILRLVKEREIPTQRELLDALIEEGFQATQATVSRDIKDLRIVKNVDKTGGSRYSLSADETEKRLGKYRNIFRHSAISVDYAGNVLVIRCHTGTAQAACAALDMTGWKGMVGTLAGDDTIFALCRTPEAAAETRDAIAEILG